MSVSLCYMRLNFFGHDEAPLSQCKYMALTGFHELFASSLEKQNWEQVIKIPGGNTRVKGSCQPWIFWAQRRALAMSTLAKCRGCVDHDWYLQKVQSHCRSSCVRCSTVLLFRYAVHSCDSTSQPFHRAAWLLIFLGLGFPSAVWNY